jgi:hypothetical protein
MFNRAFGTIGLVALVLVTLIVSFTNTWKFIVEFLPPDPFWLRLCGFIFFEGAVILWAHLLKHTTDNVLRTIIAGAMTLISLSAVLSATFYEVALDLHSLHFHMDATVLAWVPVSVLLVMAAQVVSLLLYHFSDPYFFARLSYLNTYNTTPKTRTVKAPVKSSLATRVSPAESPAQLPKNTKTLTRLGAAWQAFVGHSDNKTLIPQNSSASEPSFEDVGDDEYEEYVGDNNEEYDEENEGEYAPVEAQTSSVSMPRNSAVQRPQRKAYRTFEQSKEALALFVEKQPGITDAALAAKVGCSIATVRRWRKE